MKLDQLKQIVNDHKVEQMKPIYEQLKRDALEGHKNSGFTYVDYRTKGDEGKSLITEEEIEHLKANGYAVEWREKVVTVSGW